MLEVLFLLANDYIYILLYANTQVDIWQLVSKRFFSALFNANYFTVNSIKSLFNKICARSVSTIGAK
jgi:hypothetical protein